MRQYRIDMYYDCTVTVFVLADDPQGALKMGRSVAPASRPCDTIEETGYTILDPQTGKEWDSNENPVE